GSCLHGSSESVDGACDTSDCRALVLACEHPVPVAAPCPCSVDSFRGVARYCNGLRDSTVSGLDRTFSPGLSRPCNFLLSLSCSTVVDDLAGGGRTREPDVHVDWNDCAAATDFRIHRLHVLAFPRQGPARRELPLSECQWVDPLHDRLLLL